MPKSYVPRENTKIILVDSQLDLLHVYKKFFQAAGLGIFATFSNTKDLVSFFVSKRSKNTGDKNLENSIVLLDLGIADVNNGQILKRLRKYYSTHKIILTSGGRDPPRFKIDENLFDAILIKPFTISELLQTIQKITSVIRTRGSVVLKEPEAMYKLFMDILSDSNKQVCVSISAAGFNRRIDVPEYSPVYLQARKKGLQVRIITEITAQNIATCRDLMVGRGIQIRHLEGIVENYSIYDKKHYVGAVLYSADRTKFKQLLYSNLDPIVSRNQYLFDELWEIAKPAAQKIQEFEGTQVHGKVIVVSGLDEIIAARIKMIDNAQTFHDACIFGEWLSVVSIPKLGQAWSNAVSRGVRCRIITEIQKESFDSCEALMRIGVDLRHIPNLKGVLAVSEKEFMATTSSQNPKINQEAKMMYSNYPELIEQQELIFNTLWDIATPAALRLEKIKQQGLPNQKGHLVPTPSQ